MKNKINNIDSIVYVDFKKKKKYINKESWTFANKILEAARQVDNRYNNNKHSNLNNNKHNSFNNNKHNSFNNNKHNSLNKVLVDILCSPRNIIDKDDNSIK